MQQAKPTSNKKERSISYPSLTLADAFDRAGKFEEAYGSGQCTREDAARGIGYGGISGASARAVAALVHYGLLDRSGDRYSLSELAKKAIRPVPGVDVQLLHKQAALHPKLFESLVQEYEGQPLPSMLGNVLVHRGVSRNVAEEVVGIFRESLEFAGMLRDGIVRSDIGDTGASESPKSAALTTRPAAEVGAFVFDFSGGILLTIPRTKETSEAIADGELKEARKALTEFAAKFMSNAGESAT